MKYEFPFTIEGMKSVLCGSQLEYGITRAMGYKPVCRFRIETSGRVVGWEDNMVWDTENGALVFYDSMGKKREFFSRLEVNKNGEVCIRGTGTSYLSIYKPVEIGKTVVATEKDRLDDILERLSAVNADAVCLVFGCSGESYIRDGISVLPVTDEIGCNNIWSLFDAVDDLAGDKKFIPTGGYTLLMSDRVVLRDGWKEQFESVNGVLRPDLGFLEFADCNVAVCRNEYIVNLDSHVMNDYISYQYLQDRSPVESDEEYYYGDEVRGSVRFHTMKFDLMK